MVFTAYVADLDLSYDSNRLVISAFGVGYTLDAINMVFVLSVKMDLPSGRR